LFNLNVGRDIMPSYDLEPQVVMTTPLLEGLDGVEKMSKSLGNYIGVMEGAPEMFGKLMSISDELMWRYYLLLTDLAPAGIAELRSRVETGALHPKQAKVELSTTIVTAFHGADEAARAAEQFERRYTKRELPTDVPVVELSTEDWSSPLPTRLVRCGLADSMSDARRKIQQGGVRINGVKAGGAAIAEFDAQDADEYLLQVGKHAAVTVRRKK
jgi:tyrosyl-tRNA synthetase